MLKAYKVEINPTHEQKIKINKTIGVCKFVYNLYIGHNKDIYKNEKRFISGMSFSKWLNNDFIQNNPSYSWIKEVSSKAVKQSIMNGDKAFKRFFKGESKFPRFKKKSDTSVKMYLPKNNKTDWTIERHRIKIPTLKFVKLKEFGYIPANAKVKSGTVSRIADRYFVSVLVEEAKFKNVKKQTEQIGVDLGIKKFAFVSNGVSFKNINKSNKVKKLEKKLKREQRALSRKFENKKKRRSADNKSTNIEKNKLRIQKLHYKLSCKRKEYVKFVVNSLVKNNPKFIAIEDLNISGMMRNRHLSKAIQQQSFYYFKQYLISKCNKQGIEVRLIDRWYPSSKTCNVCGVIKPDLKLSDRVFKCKCSHVEDRDLNASKNIRDCEVYKIAK